MSCWGLGFMATRPEVNGWSETRPTDIPLTLMLGVSEYAMRLLIHELSLFDKMETDALNYIYKLHHPTEWTGFFAVVSRRSSVSEQLLLMPRVVFSRHQTRFPLVKGCCHSDSLTGWEERSLSLDVVNVSWLSEWGNVTAETYDLVHYMPRLTFPGTWNSTSAEFLLWSKFFWLKHILLGFFGSEGEAPHQPDFHNVIILVDLCISNKICSSVCLLVWEMQINWMCNRLKFFFFSPCTCKHKML